MKGFYITMQITENCGNVSLYFFERRYTNSKHLHQIKWSGTANKRIFKTRKAAESNYDFICATYKGVQGVKIELNEY